MNQHDQRHHIVIIGGGFGGLNAAKKLGRSVKMRVTLLDKRNFHLFQPLLYQVATGGLSPGDIAYPLREAVSRAKNIEVVAAEAVDILPNEQRIILRDGDLTYDSLIVATGASHHYFGHDEWAEEMPGLKSIEDALFIRRRILLAFETAERETDPQRQQAWLNFVVVGGGATGVEMAGAISELAKETLQEKFTHINPGQSRIILVEGTDRVLNTFPTPLSDKAKKALTEHGVELLTGTLLTDSKNGVITLRDTSSGAETQLTARTIIWAAGVKASYLGPILCQRAGIQPDNLGRVIVNPDMTLPGYSNIFVIGDLAHYAHQMGEPLPGVAQVAMQQGVYVARLLLVRESDKAASPFRYKDKGTLAVIGRNAAVANIGSLHLSGYFAWLIWIFVHISFLIGFDNKLLVMLQWAWYYLARKRGALLITGKDPYPLIEISPHTDKT
ncbi:MAG: NAD(P)/FAD-dependent oxidoreductase [Chloroflexi bacterium]|nr:NAD(P)/FAD-dependent oxidoreductase [Chloroflexota bacterium]